MTYSPTFRRAAALLLAAAALPAAPLLAQQPAETVTQPAPTPVPTPAPAPAPAATQPTEVPSLPREVTPAAPTPSDAATPAPAARAATPRRAPARAAAPRAAPRAAPVRQAASVNAAAPVPVAEIPAEAAPAAETALPPIALPPAPVAPQPIQPAEEGGGSSMVWALLGALALGGLALFALLRRRRRTDDEVYEEAPAAYDEPVRQEALRAAAPDRAVPASAAAIPIAAAATPVPATPVEQGRPALDLALRPIRAGVAGRDAVVEFELDIDNRGSAAANDVRISTWMFAAGGSESERALIDHGQSESVPAIAAGTAGHLTSSVSLPTANVESDAVLPVVVAEARYTLPDGSEARTSATYAVGVQDGEELAHFAIDNPSGLHDGVVAWEMGRTQPA